MTFFSSAKNIAIVIRSLLLALAIVAAVSPAQADTDLTGRNEAIVRKAFEEWTSGRGNIFDLLSPDIRWTIHGSGPVAGTYNGLADFVQRASVPLVSRLATPLTPDVHHIWASGDNVIIRFDASAITTSRSPYNNQFIWIFRMKDDLVVEAEAFLDLVAYQDVVDNNEPRER
ncbi:nuclear transport factor 2 family protein [Pectobacterium cacticida]|uniref:nuclear transport factor 2 family protein n=1 Tax=Pectobacterium cacticida TaxID=69221 RepID=UPI002FF015F1